MNTIDNALDDGSAKLSVDAGGDTAGKITSGVLVVNPEHPHPHTHITYTTSDVGYFPYYPLRMPSMAGKSQLERRVRPKTKDARNEDTAIVIRMKAIRHLSNDKLVKKLVKETLTDRPVWNLTSRRAAARVIQERGLQDNFWEAVGIRPEEHMGNGAMVEDTVRDADVVEELREEAEFESWEYDEKKKKDD